MTYIFGQNTGKMRGFGPCQKYSILTFTIVSKVYPKKRNIQFCRGKRALSTDTLLASINREIRMKKSKYRDDPK